MKPVALRISVAQQRLDVVHADGYVFRSYVISTSSFGLGSEPGSYKTPTGRFKIAEKIGDGAELGMIFKSRQPIGRLGGDEEPDDFVQTRILWLAGCEPHNANTRERYVYIHGTNQESGLGLPLSHGCIRMGNAEIADLFPLVASGSAVEIA